MYISVSFLSMLCYDLTEQAHAIGDAVTESGFTTNLEKLIIVYCAMDL